MKKMPVWAAAALLLLAAACQPRLPLPGGEELDDETVAQRLHGGPYDVAVVVSESDQHLVAWHRWGTDSCRVSTCKPLRCDTALLKLPPAEDDSSLLALIPINDSTIEMHLADLPKWMLNIKLTAISRTDSTFGFTLRMHGKTFVRYRFHFRQPIEGDPLRDVRVRRLLLLPFIDDDSAWKEGRDTSACADAVSNASSQ